MSETIQLWGLTIYPYGLIIAAAALVQLLIMGVAGYLRRLPGGTVRVFGVLALLLGLVFSRLVFCLFQLPLFTETYANPWLMLRFFDGGLSMSGLLMGLLLAAFLTARLMDVPLGKLTDVMTLPLGLFIAGCRAAEAFTDLGVGKVVEESGATRGLPWLFLTEQAGVAAEYRLAVFGYEAAVGVLIFLFMLWMFHAFQKPRYVPGDAALLFFALYGATQMILESMRDDGHLLLTFLRVSQVFAALMPLIVTAILTRRYLRAGNKRKGPLILSWTLLLLCVAAGVLLEFSLDGRVTFGSPSLLRDYSIMAALCVILFAVPCSLLFHLRKTTRKDVRVSLRV